ncbi:ankyrin repeat-containing domain protein [Nemania diffusa]|nr:ankyrin repeat-containing domain protein [Nemania diffusa]
MLHAYMPANLNNEPIWSKELISTIIHPRNLQWAKNSQLGVSKLAAIIGTAMPESYSGENLQRAESLLHRSAEDFLHESLSMLIYSLSNNAVKFYDDDDGNNRWKTTMAMLKRCGIMNTKLDVKKLNSLTINGFMEKLLQATINRLYVVGDVEYEEITALLTWILASGYIPTIHSDFVWGYFGPRELGRSAQASVGEIKLRLMRYLLAIGIDANPIVSDDALSGIISSSGSRSVVFRMVDLLLDHDASLNLDNALHRAIEARDMDLVDMIVRRGGNLRTEFEHPYSFIDKNTALVVAAATGLSETKHIISCLVAQNPLEPIANFVTASTFISAALKGQDDTLQYLYSINSSVPTAHKYGITPLHAAASRGHLTTCQLLYPLYGTQVSDIEPIFSPLHAACKDSHPEVVEFLIAKGADVNAATKFGSLLSKQNFLSNMSGIIRSDSTPLRLVLGSSPYYILSKPHASCVSMLIRSGARLLGYEVAVAADFLYLELASTALEAGGDPNENHPNSRPSPLKRALQSCIPNQDDPTFRFSIVSLLLQKGAKLLGGEVISAISAPHR